MEKNFPTQDLTKFQKDYNITVTDQDMTYEAVLGYKARLKKAENFFLEHRDVVKQKDNMIFQLQKQLETVNQDITITQEDLIHVQKIEQEVKTTEKILKIKHPNLKFTRDDLCTIHSISKENNLNLTSKDIWIYESQGKNIIVVSIYAYRKIAASYAGHHYGIKYLFGVKGSNDKMEWVDLVENTSDIKYCKAIMTHIDPMGRSLDTEITMEVKNYVKTTATGKPTGTWAKYPLTMIQKVAEGQVIRAKFPSLGGTLTEDEIQDIQDSNTKEVKKNHTIIDTSEMDTSEIDALINTSEETESL